MKLNEFIEIPPEVSVFQDKQTGARTVAFPFDFNDGQHGVLMVTRLSKLGWQPTQDITSITINFNKPDEDKTVGGDSTIKA